MNKHFELIKNASSDSLFLIIGFGLTGKALARFCESKKWSYVIYDDKPHTEQTGPYCKDIVGTTKAKQLISQNKITAFFPSPGVSMQHELIQLACKNNIPIIGELELASFYLKGDFIAVTGTNGKSTTAMLINALLEDAGIPNRLSGNIGSPLIDAVNETPYPYYVIEESSYQLELTNSLKHHIAICLNVTEDHFERYTDINDYANAKENVIKNSLSSDWFIYNFDNPYTLAMSKRTQAKTTPFSLVNHLNKPSAICDKNNMVIKLNDKNFIFDLNNCSLKGLHNTENMLASLMATLIIKSDNDSYQSYTETLKNFTGLNHRMQKVHTENSVDYYDDSKATNVDSVVMALASFDGNIILIAGGKSKQCDYTPLKGIIKHKVKKLILLGEAKNEMHEAFKDNVSIELVENMQEAVGLAKKTAKPGDIVLLSPACSSYDQYKNFVERGLDFQQLCKNNV